MSASLEKGARFIWENARLLERAIFDYRLYGSSPAPSSPMQPLKHIWMI